LSDLLSGAGWPVWRYEFDLAPDGGRSFHAAEIGYVMENKSFGPAITLQDYWLAFAQSGKPAVAGKPAWPAYAPGRSHMTFDARGATPGADLAATPCDWMDRI
jgi:para-nitrobenzyl esterase